MLRLQGLTVCRGRSDEPVIVDLAAGFDPGAISGIAGGNGSGKTTLAFVLAGILPRIIEGSWEGQVTFGGSQLELTGWPSSVVASYTSQDHSGHMMLGSLEDVVSNLPDDLREVASAFPMPAPRTEVRSHSTGQRHLLDWLLCQARRPQILLLDELLGSLDPGTAELLVSATSHLHQSDSRVTILIDQNAERLSSYTEAAILELGSADFSDETLRGARETGSSLGSLMFRKEVARISPEQSAPLGGRWPGSGTSFLIDSLPLREQTCTRLRGAVGSGKSTILKALSGFPGPKGDARTRRLRKVWNPIYIGLPDQFVATHATIDELLRAFFGEGHSEAIWGELKNFLPGREPCDDPGILSYGQRRLLALVCLMSRAEAAMALDEPDKGLDPRAQEFVIGVISVFLDRGGSCALASHNKDFIERLASAVSPDTWCELEVREA